MSENKVSESAAHWEQIETVDVPDVPEELLQAWRKAVAGAAPASMHADPMAAIEARLSAIESTLQDIRNSLDTRRRD